MGHLSAVKGSGFAAAGASLDCPEGVAIDGRVGSEGQLASISRQRLLLSPNPKSDERPGNPKND